MFSFSEWHRPCDYDRSIDSCAVEYKKSTGVYRYGAFSSGAPSGRNLHQEE